MSSTTRTPHPPTNGSSQQPTYFQQQRDALLGEITISLEHVLQNMNKLNRSLEGVIAVGDEFGSVERVLRVVEYNGLENVRGERDVDGV